MTLECFYHVKKTCSDSLKTLMGSIRCAKPHTEPPQLTGNQPELGQVAEEEAVMRMTTGFEMVIWLPVFSLITETVF